MATKHSNGKPLRAVGYCRTSGEGQRDNTSIPTQKDRIKTLCESNGWKLVKFHVDESKSGSKIAGRDDFQLMMRDAASGKFDVVVVFDITRFARDGFDIIGSSRSLKRDFGVDVVDTKGQYDTRDRRNTLTNFIHAGVSEHERVSIMDRMMGGRIRKAEEGKPWTSVPPVGRAYDKKTGKWFVTDKGRAIAQVLRRYVQGESLKPLCAELGISRAAKVSDWVWHGQLAGTYVAKFRSPEIEVEVDVPVPQIPEVVPLALLEKAKTRLRHNRTFNRTDVRKYHLSGFVRCGDCGKALTGQSRDDVRYYRHPKSECPIKSVRSDQIESAVLDYLYGFFLDEPAFNEAVTRAMPSADHRIGLVKKRKQAEKRLAENDRKIKRLIDAIENGADPQLLVSRQDELKADKQVLTERLQQLDTEIATLPSAEHIEAAAMMTRLRLMQEHQGKDWRALPYEDVKRFLFHLFGETTPKSETGILVQRDEHGRLVITFRGKVDFHHLIMNGRPLSKSFIIEAETLNAEALGVYQRAVQAADREHDRASNELRPLPADQSAGATRPRGQGGGSCLPAFVL